MNNISLNTIFSNWYKDTYGTKTEATSSKSVSIFSHVNEFKEFLVCEMDADSSIYTKSINSLLSIDFSKEIQEYKEEGTPEYFVSEDIQLNEKGEYIINDEDLTRDSEEDFNPYEAIVGEVYGLDYNSQDGQKILEQLKLANENNTSGSYTLIDATKALNPSTNTSKAFVARKDINMDDVLSELVTDEEIIGLIDNDFDDELSQEELDLFFEKIKNLDGNNEDISLDDILNGIEELKNNNLQIDEPAIEETKKTETPIQTSSGSGSSGGSSDYQNKQTQEKSLNQMSSEELNVELQTRQQALEDKKSALQNAINGTGDSQLASLKTKMDEAEQAYKTKLEEIKTTDKELVEKVEAAQENLENKQKTVDDYTIKISNQEAQVLSLTSAVNDAQVKVDSLIMTQASLNAINTSEMTPEEAADIQSKKSAITEAISRAKEAKAQAQAALDSANEELATLKEAKSTADAELNEAKSSLQTAENELSNAHPEIAQIQQEYNSAKEEYETRKSAVASEAQQAILEAQASVNEVNSAIKNKETKEEVKEYSPNAISQYNEEEGARIAQAALEYALAGHSTSCGASVRIVLESLGYTGIQKCKGKEWAETNLANRDDFVEITTDTIIQDYIQETGYSLNTNDFNELIKNNSDFENYFKNYLPVGTVVCFGEYEYFGYGPGDSGHVGIVTSQNGTYVEASGYVRKEGVNTNLIKHGAEFRAFIPC